MFSAMKPLDAISRRSFLALAGAAPFAFGATKSKHVPVGLELYSVRDELAKDLPAWMAIDKDGRQRNLLEADIQTHIAKLISSDYR